MLNLMEVSSCGSDVSSNSSWTLLADEDDDVIVIEDEEEVDPLDAEEEGYDDDKEVLVESDFVAVLESEVDGELAEQEEEIESAPVVQGCQTLEEYLMDRQIVHDYGYDERAEHWEEYLEKRNRKKRRRQKSDVVSIFKVMGAFLSIAGITFACVLLPKTSAPFNSVEPRRYYRNHYPQAANEEVVKVKPLDVVIENKPPDLSKPSETAQEALKVIRHNHAQPKILQPPPKEVPKCSWNKAKPVEIKTQQPKVHEKSFFEDMKQKISNLFFTSSSDGKSSTIKANFYLALHILNDLVLIRATGQLRRDIEAKLKGLKSKKTQIKRCKKIVKTTQKKQASSVENKKELFKELPFETKRAPIKPTINYIDFFHELQDIKARKSELLKTFNSKSRKLYVQTAKQDKKLDKYYLTHKYESSVTDATTKQELFCCLSYLHARKRDFSSLITKLDVNDILVQSPKYQSLLEKLFLMEDAIVQYFQADKPVTAEYQEIGAVVDLLLLKLKKKKDASTERYVVPIPSACNIPSVKASQTESNLNWPVKNASNVEAKIAEKISQEKIEVLKTWKEKYEQLKQFWKSRQEYYDRRVEICNLIIKIIPEKKQKLQQENTEEMILDELIHEVINKNEDNSTRESRVLIQNVATDLRQALKKDDNNNNDVRSAPWRTYEAVFERRGNEIYNSDQKLFNTTKYPKVFFKQISSKQDPGKAAKNLIAIKTTPV